MISRLGAQSKALAAVETGCKQLSTGLERDLSRNVSRLHRTKGPLV